MRGLPASGKSTESDKLLERNNEEPGTIKVVRINRSTLRNMFWPKHKWSKEYEALVREIEYNMASQLIYSNYDVIIDSTNLPDHAVRRWKKLRKESIVIDLRNVPLETCLMRNMIRETNKCNIEVIIKLARENKLLK